MRWLLMLVVFVVLIGNQVNAGENQDKRKRKAQERTEEMRRREEEYAKTRFRDLSAEDQLLKEIAAQEYQLSQLRRRLEILHRSNERKYGPRDHYNDDDNAEHYNKDHYNRRY